MTKPRSPDDGNVLEAFTAKMALRLKAGLKARRRAGGAGVVEPQVRRTAPDAFPPPGPPPEAEAPKSWLIGDPKVVAEALVKHLLVVSPDNYTDIATFCMMLDSRTIDGQELRRAMLEAFVGRDFHSDTLDAAVKSARPNRAELQPILRDMLALSDQKPGTAAVEDLEGHLRWIKGQVRELARILRVEL